MLETAHANGISALLNLSPVKCLLRPVYRMVSHLIINETEVAILTDQSPEDLASIEAWASVTDTFLSMDVENVVITLGAKGAYYSNTIGQGGHIEAEKMSGSWMLQAQGRASLTTYRSDHAEWAFMSHAAK